MSIAHRVRRAAIVLTLCVLGFACSSPAPLFHVNEIVSDPGSFSGPIAVRGVTFAHSESNPGIVGIMDVKELQCSTPGCAKSKLLPVSFPGGRPDIGTEIKATGSVVRETWGFVLKADSVEVLNRHNLGGGQ